MRSRMLFACLLLSHAASAQSWEIGAVAGGGFARKAAASLGSGSARAGLESSLAAGALLGQDLYRRLSGEIRYTFRPGALAVDAGGQATAFNAVTHALHYDLLFHARPAGSPVRPFLAGGAGVRVFRGTGRETVYQPLQDYVLLTKTQEWKPLVSAGGGVQVSVARSLRFRVEARAYSTPFPSKVITPAAGARIRGWLHELVPLAGIGFVF